MQVEPFLLLRSQKTTTRVRAGLVANVPDVGRRRRINGLGAVYYAAQKECDVGDNTFSTGEEFLFMF